MHQIGCFNPRARDGREIREAKNIPYKGSFNPRARDGREGYFIQAEIARLVSIHAPVMDANLCSRRIAIGGYVSIHAPVMDANCAKMFLRDCAGFQSTRP